MAKKAPSLPSYLVRHFDLGFDSDDIAALLSSMEPNDDRGTHSLPHLPAEILFHILEHVPISYVLDFRLVCRGFRDCIDTRGLYSYLRRTELLGFIDLKPSPGWGFSPDECEELHCVRASFSHLENVNGVRQEQDPRAKWNGTCAVFRLDDGWFETYSHTNYSWTAEDFLLNAQLNELSMPFDRLGWCIKLDHSVLDVASSCCISADSFLDEEKRTIKVEWRTMFKDLLKTEMAIRKKMEETQKQHFDYTFGPHEDCLREIRRHRARCMLNPDDAKDQILSWELRSLRPLFGRPGNNRAPGPRYRYSAEAAENAIIPALMVLRKAAAMSDKDRAYLKQLARDSHAMELELFTVNELFSKWKASVYNSGAEPRSYSQPAAHADPSFAEIPYNPVAWSEEIISREEQRVRKWKSQKKTREKLEALLREANKALDVLEYGFNDLDSDF